MSTTCLVSRPTFLSGFARAFDWWGRYHCYNYSRSPEQADVNALVGDWLATYDELSAGLEIVLTEDPALLKELEQLLAQLPHPLTFGTAEVPQEQDTPTP